MGQSEGDSAFSGPIHLGKDEPVYGKGLAEEFYLINGVLAGGGVDYQKVLVGGPRLSLFQPPGPFF